MFKVYVVKVVNALQCSRRGILEANFRAHASKTQVFVANNIEIDRKHVLVFLDSQKLQAKVDLYAIRAILVEN